ncbi:MAG: site-2 protease family protein [Gemmatimonadaceae bacterium]|nr:site-2 protease family protein [Gemmatimonadaceae bacterium]
MSRKGTALTLVPPIASLPVRRPAPPATALQSRHPLDKLQEFLLVAPVLLFSMVAHEFAHGYAALKQGDPTAFQLGRLTWNPLKHIDPFFTILLPVITFFAGGFIFGGAKPVPVTPRNYRNYRRGDIIVSLAGIASNLAIAVACVAITAAIGWTARAVPSLATTASLLQRMAMFGVLFNLVLAVFNLLPLPPLDGSHVVKYLLPPAWAIRYQQVGMYGIFILVFMLMTKVGGVVLSFWMTPVIRGYEIVLRSVYDLLVPSPISSLYLQRILGF